MYSCGATDRNAKARRLQHRKGTTSIWIDRVQLRCYGPQRGSQQIFTNPKNLTRVDVNEDGRVDQLDLRVLLRYLSGLRGTELAEQEVSEEIIELLLGLEQP